MQHHPSLYSVFQNSFSIYFISLNVKLLNKQKTVMLKNNLFVMFSRKKKNCLSSYSFYSFYSCPHLQSLSLCDFLTFKVHLSVSVQIHVSQDLVDFAVVELLPHQLLHRFPQLPKTDLTITIRVKLREESQICKAELNHG